MLRSSYTRRPMRGDDSCGFHAQMDGLSRLSAEKKSLLRTFGCPLGFGMRQQAGVWAADDMIGCRALFADVWASLKYVLIGSKGDGLPM